MIDANLQSYAGILLTLTTTGAARSRRDSPNSVGSVTRGIPAKDKSTEDLVVRQ